MIKLITVGILLTQLHVAGAAIRHFNPGIFGQSVDEPVTLLLPGDAESLHPISVMADVKEGRYIAATANYPRKISFEKVREEINRRYESYEVELFRDHPEMGLWRNEDDAYAIQLTEEEDVIQIIYISFMSFDETRQHIEEIYPNKDPLEVLRPDQAESEQDSDDNAEKPPGVEREP